MPSSVFITTTWGTRSRAVKCLQKFGKYTTESNITVVQNGKSQKDLKLYLEKKTGLNTFDFKCVKTPTTHGKIWNWCMESTLYNWVLIINDTHYPTDYWDFFFDTLTKRHPHKIYLLDSLNGTEAFAIQQSYWQKLGFNNNMISKKAQIYHLLLRIGFMETLKRKEDLLKTTVFPYLDYYNEPLFSTGKAPIKIIEDLKELEYLWDEDSALSGVEDLDGITRKPKRN